MRRMKTLLDRLDDLQNNMGSAIYEDADTCGEAADELRRLYEVERKYEMALHEGMKDCVERWGGYRSTQVTGSEYDRYLARMVTKFDEDVERLSRMKDLPTVSDAVVKLGENSYEIRVLRAAIAKATTP